MKRARDHGIEIGRLATGPLNAISDVEGVQVGHIDCIEGDRIRTGATVIMPHWRNIFREKCRAGVATLNGYGKLAGASQLDELGELETPILLTNTMAVGRGIQALIEFTISHPENRNVTSVNSGCW